MTRDQFLKKADRDYKNKSSLVISGYNPFGDLMNFWRADEQPIEESLDLFISSNCPSCGKPLYGKFMFTFPVSLPFEELCTCGQLKSRSLDSTINMK